MLDEDGHAAIDAEINELRRELAILAQGETPDTLPNFAVLEAKDA